MRARHACIGVLGSVTVAVAASCDRQPTAPTPEPIVTRVELVAPRSLAPGATVQLRLIAHRSDGSTEDVTSGARFSGSSSDVLRTSADGVVTALAPGDGSVSGNTQTHADAHEIVVVPNGTYRVMGQVVEGAPPGVAVGGARVEADGAAATETDLSGRYRLYGVAGNGRLRVSKAGYVARDVALSISDHHTENVFLTPDGPRTDVAGLYQMIFQAGPGCQGHIPDVLLTRRYTAAVTQRGDDIQVVLSGARFWSMWQPPSDSIVIPGRVDQGQVHLSLVWPTHCDFAEDSSLRELVDDTTYLEISGEASLSPAGQGFAGTLRGDLVVREHSACGSARTLACSDGFHRVMLTR